MTKELLIEILKTNSNLYTVIDSFIELNYDNRYGENIQEIYEQSYNITKFVNKDTWIISIGKVSPLIITTIFYIIAGTHLIFITTSKESLWEYYTLYYGNSPKVFEEFCYEANLIKAFIKVQCSLIEITEFLVTFKNKLFTTKEFEDLYIENIASFINAKSY